MTKKQRPGWAASSLAFLFIGVTVGSSGVLQTQAFQVMQAPAAYAGAANPQEHSLDANLYRQTSAEYAAVCIQTYNWALERLRQKLATVRHGERRPAVVMDLDETVFDNSGFYTFLYREKLNYSDELWERWERDFPQEVGLVPGAQGFVEEAERMGVAVVYISNRMAKHQSSTIAALHAVGLNTEGIGERLLLREQASDKTARRKLAEQRYDVLMYVGDNLRDFSEEFVAPKLAADDDAAQRRAIAERLGKVKRAAYRWGNDWIVLPNPLYGEWQRLIGANPVTKMRATEMKK